MSEACALCGDRGDVLHGIIAIRPEYQTGRVFEVIPTCRDRRACRARVEASGEPWTVDDRISRPEPQRRRPHGTPG